MLRATSILWVVGLLAPACINAGVVYDISVISPGNGLDPISFSFTSPSYITPGSFAITPFTVTNGPDTWTFTQALASTNCFVFGTALTTLTPCIFSYPTPWSSPEGGFSFLLATGPPGPSYLPTTDGTITRTGGYRLLSSFPAYYENPAFSAQIAVSTVPEPGGASLLVLPLAFVAWRIRLAPRQKSQAVEPERLG